MCATTAAELLNDKPTDSEVERVDTLWSMFNSTTQLLSALRLVLIEREVLDHEVKALDQFLPILAQAEADNMNTPIVPNDTRKEFWHDPCWRERAVAPITQR